MPRLRIATLVVLLFLETTMFGQAPAVVGGLPAFSTFDANSIATVNLANLNVHLDIPLRSLPGRGVPFNAHLVRDTVWGTPTTFYPYTSGVIWGGNGVSYPLGA